MDVRLGIGFDNIHFGLNQISLENLIGKPSKIDTDSSDNQLLKYNSLRCTFWMDDDGRLHWIQCSNPSLRLKGISLIGNPVKDVIANLSSVIGSTYEFEDYGAMESYSFPEYELEIQVEYGLVSNLCFGHYWKGDEPIYSLK